MLSQTMLFSFPFVLVMGVTNEENFDGSSSRPDSSTGGNDYGDRSESCWQSNCPSFVH